MKRYCTLETPIGIIAIAETNGAITNLFFSEEVVPNSFEFGESEILSKAKIQLLEYFCGQRKKFDLRFKLDGTLFQQKVWSSLNNIPYGKTISYKGLAEIIGKEKAYRAVGQANNKNPLPIFFPCHRVVGKNGSLRGYAGGLDIKKQLLEAERILHL